jgi:hypothetical protein
MIVAYLNKYIVSQREYSIKIDGDRGLGITRVRAMVVGGIERNLKDNKVTEITGLTRISLFVLEARRG